MTVHTAAADLTAVALSVNACATSLSHRETRLKRETLTQSHDVILFLALPNHEQHAVNRLRTREPHLHVRCTTVVDVHTA